MYKDKLINAGYKLETYSNWEGDKGKYFICIDNAAVASINTNNKTISPCHGYYGNYCKHIAILINYKLIQ